MLMRRLTVAGAPRLVEKLARCCSVKKQGVTRGLTIRARHFLSSFRQPLDAHRQSPSCFLARQKMNLPAMLSRHMKDGFVERG